MARPPDVPIASAQDAIFTDSPPGGMPLTVQYTRRTLRMLTVTEVELDTVASLGNSIHLTMLGISAGTFVTCVITLFTVPIPDPKMAAIFSGVTWVSGIATMYFGARGAVDYLAAQRKLRDIKAGLS